MSQRERRDIGASRAAGPLYFHFSHSDDRRISGADEAIPRRKWSSGLCFHLFLSALDNGLAALAFGCSGWYQKERGDCATSSKKMLTMFMYEVCSPNSYRLSLLGLRACCAVGHKHKLPSPKKYPRSGPSCPVHTCRSRCHQTGPLTQSSIGVHCGPNCILSDIARAHGRLAMTTALRRAAASRQHIKGLMARRPWPHSSLWTMQPRR